MRTTDIEMILETYNAAEDKELAIENLARMLKVHPGEIREKIEKWGRKPKKTKAEQVGKPENAEKTKESEKNPLVPRAMGPHVQDVLFNEIAFLEKRIDELRKELAKAEADYKETTDFVFGFTP